MCLPSIPKNCELVKKYSKTSRLFALARSKMSCCAESWARVVRLVRNQRHCDAAEMRTSHQGIISVFRLGFRNCFKGKSLRMCGWLTQHIPFAQHGESTSANTSFSLWGLKRTLLLFQYTSGEKKPARNDWRRGGCRLATLILIFFSRRDPFVFLAQVGVSLNELVDWVCSQHSSPLRHSRSSLRGSSPQSNGTRLKAC